MKTYLYKKLIIIALFFVSVNSFSQNIIEKVDAAFRQMQLRPPMEKLYLHLDKSTYLSGETVWFSGHLVIATGNIPAALSNFIYVELYNDSDSLVYRKKIKKIDDVFSGNIKLSSDLKEGDYFLRAYTLWMLNSGLDFIFKKTIHIDNLLDNKIQSQIEFKQNEDGGAEATIAFFDNKGNPINNTRINCFLKLNAEKSQSFKRKTGEDGKISFGLDKNEEWSAEKFIEVSFENSSSSYQQKFYFPATFKRDFDVQFFPEGGELIIGNNNQIAFKAINQNGMSTDISGYIVNDRNDTITTFNSQYLGFGSFYLNPQKGNIYYAVVHNLEGVSKTFTLPPASKNGCALSAVWNENLLELNVRIQNNLIENPLYIIAHFGDYVLFTQTVERMQYIIPMQELPEGIISFVLVDEKMNPISSRLVFNKKQNIALGSAQQNKLNYGKREAVSLSVQLQKTDSLFRKGNFSISVTDDLVVDIDSLADNIRSNLLLTSDLKGHIENPAFYFMNNADTTNHYLDLLMLTQGWRRFNIKNIMQNNLQAANYYLELGQTISGKYEKRILSRKKNTEITALSVNPLISVSTETDENNNFIFNEMDFPDSTVFTIQSQRYSNIKQEPTGVIKLDIDTFPPFIKSGFSSIRNSNLKGKYLENAQDRIYYVGDGKMILLDEFVVKAADKSKNYEIEYGLSSNVIDEEQIAKTYPISQTADFIIKMLPGAFPKGDQIYFGGHTTPAEIILDGTLADLSMLSFLNAEDIARIVVIKDASAALYARNGGMGGVVLVHLKEGGSFEYDQKGVVKYMPLGYQKQVEFYTPKYEVDSVRNSKNPDMRTTIYWNPKVEITSTSIANIDFYTADPNTTYTYILEGVTNLGEVCRFRGKINRQ